MTVKQHGEIQRQLGVIWGAAEGTDHPAQQLILDALEILDGLVENIPVEGVTK